MSMTHSVPMTRAEFLAWEARQELRWEFDGLRLTAMTGGTEAHASIQFNLARELSTRLRGTGCKGYGPDLKVATAEGYRYPDAQVTCTAIAPKATVSEQLVAIFEVISESTARLDRTVKLSEYGGIKSVQYYIMLEQTLPFATVISRTESGWAMQVLNGSGTIGLPLLKIELPLDGLYEGVTFETTAGDLE